MLSAMLWNTYHPEESTQPLQGEDHVDPIVGSFLQNFCQNDQVYCHEHLQSIRRTQQVHTKKSTIPSDATILTIPRHLQVWDWDALQNDFVRQHLFLARRRLPSNLAKEDNDHHPSEQPLSSAAFLAAHISRLLEATTDKNDNKRDTSNTQPTTSTSNLDPLLQQYLSTLPTLADFQSFHPILWTKEYRTDDSSNANQELYLKLLRPTYTYSVLVSSFRQLLDSEYHAFAAVSSDFAQQVPRSVYMTARLHVLTRAFGTGPMSSTTKQYQQEQLKSIQQRFGVDLSQGSFAMVPILDSYDHYAQPNVAFSYQSADDQGGGDFVISTTQSIASGYQIFDSYGKRSDPDLFARYGFVNGDGSDYSQASIAVFHQLDVTDTLATAESPNHASYDDDDASRPSQPITQQLARQIVRYLQYDDGYYQCVSPPVQDNQNDDSHMAWELKTLKYRYLLERANDPKFWVATISPRKGSHKKSQVQPPRSTNTIIHQQQQKGEIPKMDLRTIQFNATTLFSTCRVIVLTHHDYDGQAVTLLRENLNVKDYVLPPATDNANALEYRTLMCMARLASTALQRFQGTIQEEIDLIHSLAKQYDVNHRNASTVSSQNTPLPMVLWRIRHVRLGEMQSLQAIKDVAFSKLRAQYGNDLSVYMDSSKPDFVMRNEPCPPTYWRTLPASLDSFSSRES